MRCFRIKEPIFRTISSCTNGQRGGNDPTRGGGDTNGWSSIPSKKKNIEVGAEGFIRRIATAAMYYTTSGCPWVLETEAIDDRSSKLGALIERKSSRDLGRGASNKLSLYCQGQGLKNSLEGMGLKNIHFRPEGNETLGFEKKNGALGNSTGASILNFKT